MTPEQEQRLREIDRRWEEERGRGISWYVLDVADLRRYLRQALEENRFLRQRVEHLENGIMEIARQLGGDSHGSESVRELPVGQAAR